MRILLTGANGFTGRHFAAQAYRAGHEVVALRADLTMKEAVKGETIASRADAVVHLAAISYVGHENEEAFYAVNVLGTKNLLDALTHLEARPRAVLLASSANVYGNCSTLPIPETAYPAPANHYAISKLAMEHMALTYQDRLRIIVARPFNYTGPGQDEVFIVPKLAKHFALRRPSVRLGNLDVEREFNDVRSVCDAYLKLLQTGESGQVYNVCTGQPYSLRTIIGAMTELTGHTLAISIDPEFVRPNEIRRLCGSPNKIEALFARHQIRMAPSVLKITLQDVLSSIDDA